MLNIYADIQSIANYAKKVMGETKGEAFMHKTHKTLNSYTPHSFYMESPTQTNYKHLISLIESYYRENN